MYLILILGVPQMPYWGPTGGPYGWYPAGGVGLILVALLVLLLFGRL